MPPHLDLFTRKMASLSDRDILSFLGQDFRQFTYLPTQGTRGGILVAWRDSLLANAQRIDQNAVSVQFVLGDDLTWWFTGVYGPHQDREKVAFLDELREIRAQCTGPWCVGGDFNMIYCVEDKNNDNLNRAMIGRFRRFVNDSELKEIPLLGRRYTWSNERDAPLLSSWTGFFVRLIGRPSSRTAFCKAKQRKFQTTVLWCLGLQRGLGASHGFTLRVFGLNSPDFMRRSKIPGRSRYKLRALLSRCPSSSSASPGHFNHGVSGRLDI